MNESSLSHEESECDLPRWLQTRAITMADHSGISGRTVQDRPLHFDPDDAGVSV